MKGMYAERHNKLGRIILRAISKGSRGGDIVMADVGTAEKADADGAPACAYHHVPPDILPCLGDCTEAEQRQHAQQLHTFKPDAMLVTRGACKANTHIHIVELKTCKDTAFADQLTRAQTQHQRLMSKLVAAGYSPKNIHLVPILVGVSGTIYQHYTLDSLMELGISHTKAMACANKLHNQAILSLLSIVKTRRFFEHSNAQHNTSRPDPYPSDQLRRGCG
jgi:hypothetical protein